MRKYTFCPVPTLGTFALLAGLLRGGTASSNYDKQSISVAYEEGLPKFAVLNSTKTDLDTLPAIVKLNKTEAELNCLSNDMNITLQFQEDFFGIVYADYDRNSACKVTGNGGKTAEIILPLQGCGTLQSPARVFINNIVVRFHPGLEIDGDEVITIICRYPSPVVPVPVAPSGLVVPPTPPVRALEPLREFEILLIICAIIFLALLLLGFGCSYYCLKKRNIKVVRKRPASTLGSEITKISDPISMFGGLKIPRAHAAESSGSEEITESIQSEFISDGASATSGEEYHSTYSDQPCELPEGIVISNLHEPMVPGFDVQAVIKNQKRSVTPMSSKASSESELVLKAQEQYLTTILERTETNTLETLERIRRIESKKGPPPVHARIRVRNKQAVSDNSELESESDYSQIQSDFYEDDLYLESKETTNALADQKNEFDVNISTKYDNAGYVNTEDDDDSVFSERETSRTMHQSGLRIDLGKMETKRRFDVFIRVLDPPSSYSDTQDDLSSVFTDDERLKLKEVILHDVQIQKLIESACTVEEFVILKNHEKIQRVVEPQKWDVFIRILQNPNFMDDIYERESSRSTRSTRTGFSNLESNQELRSLSEVLVDFSTSDRDGRTSETVYAQGEFGSYAAQAAAASASASEVMEYHHYVGTSSRHQRH